MSSLENMTENSRRYPFEAHQRVSSYDPNMCTTAARFSPFYRKSDIPQPKETTEYKTLMYGLSANETQPNTSYPTNSTGTSVPLYSTFNSSDTSLVKEKLFIENHTGESVEQTIDGIAVEPAATNIVFHRSPNGHLYQNYYLASEDGMQEVVVNSCPGNTLTTIEGDNYTIAPYGFPHGCNIDTLDDELNVGNPQNLVQEQRETQKQLLEAQTLQRDQQRILLERTMSPLLAAVNNITQRDAQFSYLKQEIPKDIVHEDHRQEIPHVDRKANVYNDDSSDDDYILVSDKPVESRAVATLPTNYLYLGSIQSDTNEPSVHAKKAIPQRTKFGPFEGDTRFTRDISLNNLRSKIPRHYPLLLVEQSRILDVSNENTSNWMRFVRLAQTYAEQNVQIIEENDRIYFKCNRDIHPKEELRVGYHKTYAEKYNLPVLEPSVEDIQRKYELDNPWMCFECDQRFPTSKDMQKHLKVHDVEDAIVVSKRKVRRKPRKIKKLSDLPKNSSRCLVCFKVFMTNASLKKHFATHLTTKRSTATKSASFTRSQKVVQVRKKPVEVNTDHIERPYQCSQCDKHCATPTALAAHVRSHTNRLYSCVYCQETYKYVMNFNRHVVSHCKDGTYPCLHCQKEYKEYHLVRKHIRLFHPAVKYPCNECDRVFRNMRFLRSHKQTHVQARIFECSKCGETFTKLEDRRRHFKMNHKRTHKTKEPTPVETNQDDNQIAPVTSPLDMKPAPAAGYLQSQFKCDECRVGFKRRGMLVNHIVKRHPGQSIDSIDDLNQPIIKVQSVFNCPHCPKVYKNNAKRKAHILKNHPGMNVPPSIRKNSALSDANMQAVGCVEANIQKCHLCYKQYISRTRLLKHFRKDHGEEKMMPIVAPPSQILIEENCCEEQMLDMYKPPVSPENKLLKLSSAALELSSIEDRKFFDFLNERADTTSATRMVESEFVETSSNAELNRLPELFEETIACI